MFENERAAEGVRARVEETLRLLAVSRREVKHGTLRGLPLTTHEAVH